MIYTQPWAFAFWNELLWYLCIVRMAQPGCLCLCKTDFVDCSCPGYYKCLNCKENCVPPKKKKHLRLKRSKAKEHRTLVDKKENDPHFQFLSEDEFVKLKAGFKPANTEKSTKWAINNFTSWKIARERAGKATCPDDLLQSTDPDLLCDWLSRFVAETRTAQGKPYPPPLCINCWQAFRGTKRPKIVSS